MIKLSRFFVGSDRRQIVQSFKFSKSDVEYLGSLKTPCNKPLFPTDFLSFLESMQLTCSIYAPPEGTLVLPKTPLLRVEGPIIECQLLESILLNFINFQTLIATKAARVALAAKRQGSRVPSASSRGRRSSIGQPSQLHWGVSCHLERPRGKTLRDSCCGHPLA